MRIALLTDGIYPYVIGGMQKHSWYLARQLARNNHKVLLFHCNESSHDAAKLEFFSEEERKNIRSFLLPFPHKNYFPLHYLYESKLYSKAIYKALQPLLSDIDFVFAQGFCGWELLKHKQAAKFPPIAVHFHGLEMFQHIPSVKASVSSMLLRNAVKENIKKADYTISLGGKLTPILSAITAPEKIWEIPLGIESSWLTDAIKPAGEKIKFIFSGRYERRKGIPELNKAIEELLPTEGFTFSFIGKMPDEYKINSPLVQYHGQVTTESEMKKLVAQGDVLVCPSFAEGMPTVIMEAMASGLAIIATDRGATSLLVNNDNGWLINNPTPQQIATAMQAAMALSKPDLQNKKQHSVKKIKNGFSIEDVTHALIEKIEQALKK